jgi:uncharacterized membrane-anchored protein
LKKNFPPYIKLHLEIFANLNDKRSLAKLIKKYWNLSPSYLLRTIITKILIQNNLTEMKFINDLVKNNVNPEESKKLLIYFAIKNLNWDLARKNISGMIGANPSKEICYFMSDIELGENNDKQKSDAWIMRAENANIEDTWICRISNQTQDEWASLSNSGNYNSLVWTTHKMLRQNNN